MHSIVFPSVNLDGDAFNNLPDDISQSITHLTIKSSTCIYYLKFYLNKFTNIQYLRINCEFSFIPLIFEAYPNIELDWNLYEYHKQSVFLTHADTRLPWFQNALHDKWQGKHVCGHWIHEYGWEETVHPNDLSDVEWLALRIKYFKIRKQRQFYNIDPHTP